MFSLLIAFFCVSITLSFICSIWESVLLSITPTYAQIKLQEGSPLGRHLQVFKANIDQPLAAILTLNTVAHTVGAIGVGEQAIKIWHDSNPLITGLLVPALMTLAILLLSEIVPKTIGANNWKSLVPFTVHSLRIVIIAIYPLVWLCQLTTKTLRKDASKSIFSRSDFVALAEIGSEEGVIDSSESTIIQNLLRFKAVRVRDIMTPRVVLEMIPEDLTLREVYDSEYNPSFSRIPVYQESKDNISGYILKDDLLSELIQGNGDKKVSEIKREILAVHLSCPVPDLFRQLTEKREQISLVVDEYGGVSGIVTTEDIVETLLGIEIVDESDNIDDMQQLARKLWAKKAKQYGFSLPDNPLATDAEENKK
jgi:CBS domain containing-hemolysin-like protein